MKEIDDAFRDLAEQRYRYKWNMSVNIDYLGKAIQRMHSDDAFHGPMMDYSLSKKQGEALQAAMDRMFRALVEYYSRKE